MLKFRPDPKPNFAASKIAKQLAREKEKRNAALSHSVFYDSVWRTNPHKCFECGKPVTVKNKMNIHHLIEKRLQKYYGLINLDNTENGVILCLECHSKVHTNIDFAQKTKAQTFIIERKYDQFKVKR